MRLPAPLGSPASRQGETERLRRRVYVSVAAVACLAQLVVGALDVWRGHPLQWSSAFGVLVCAAMAGVLSLRSVPVRAVDYAVLPVVTLGVGAQLVQAWQAYEVGPRLYFVGVFLLIAAFSILPVVWAALYAVLLLAVYGVLTVSVHGDLTLLAETALIVVLIAHLTVFGQRVSAERAEASAFHTLASVDPLTQLLNRRALYPSLEAVFAGDRQAAVLLLDVDHFKLVNDRHGHAVGDEVLQQVALILGTGIGRESSVCRWGGEEFLVLLHGATLTDAVQVAERTLHVIRGAAMPGALRVTVSCGVAHARQAGTVAEWLLQADTHLYTAKQNGRDRVHAGETQVMVDVRPTGTGG